MQLQGQRNATLNKNKHNVESLTSILIFLVHNIFAKQDYHLGDIILGFYEINASSFLSI